MVFNFGYILFGFFLTVSEKSHHLYDSYSPFFMQIFDYSSSALENL